MAITPDGQTVPAPEPEPEPEYAPRPLWGRSIIRDPEDLARELRSSMEQIAWGSGFRRYAPRPSDTLEHLLAKLTLALADRRLPGACKRQLRQLRAKLPRHLRPAETRQPGPKPMLPGRKRGIVAEMYEALKEHYRVRDVTAASVIELIREVQPALNLRPKRGSWDDFAAEAERIIATTRSPWERARETLMVFFDKSPSFVRDALRWRVTLSEDRHG